ncbi:MAG: hypothetical protein JNM96_06050, partial [Bacteroidia bacterium]|nr:hypothetical protein [Bacteroidia bacterium]
MLKLKLLSFLFLFQLVCNAQRNDTTIAAPLIGVHFGGNLPLADLAKRYGPNMNAGINFMYKTKKNYLLGLDFNYLFGKNIKEDVLVNLKTEDGFMVDNSGYPADIRVSERVVTFNLYFGKVFNLLSANPNSGLVINGGAGYMQHKIHFVDAQVQIAAINGDIRNGYDRLTNGICFHQFLGYMYLSDNRLLNFYSGFEFYEGITKSVRKLNYDTGLSDTKS